MKNTTHSPTNNDDDLGQVPQYCTATEASKILGISIYQTVKLAEAGAIERVLAGKRFLYRRSTLK